MYNYPAWPKKLVEERHSEPDQKVADCQTIVLQLPLIQDFVEAESGPLGEDKMIESLTCW